MSHDCVEILGRSRVQHGHFNNRAYVMRLDPLDIPGIIPRLGALVEKNGYTKIVIRVPEHAEVTFRSAGYVTEATVPGFYAGTETALFMGKFIAPGRLLVHSSEIIADVLAKAQAQVPGEYVPHLPEGFSMRKAAPEDAPGIAALYRETFESYPFPIFEPAFIRQTMEENVRYFCICHDADLVAVSSCDINDGAKNAEMTDFATHPSFRGNGLAGCLLWAMEEHLKPEGIHLGYTIARATSYPMNLTFARAGYHFGGMLKNNTNICGTLESMNVWYKVL
ncbi:MAG: putative beta-lysine N-acetyltransferase [Methanoregula sp.]